MNIILASVHVQGEGDTSLVGIPPHAEYIKKKSSDIKGTVHPKMKIQSVNARPHVDGKPGEVSFLELRSVAALS